MPPQWMLVDQGIGEGHYNYSLRSHVDKATVDLAKQCFDAIAFRGTSGALMAAPLSLALSKSLILVRKQSEFEGTQPHSHGSMVEGDRGARNYIIVDDFISSGYTLRCIVREIRQALPRAKLVGVYLYSGGGWHEPGSHQLEGYFLESEDHRPICRGSCVQPTANLTGFCEKCQDEMMNDAASLYQTKGL